MSPKRRPSALAPVLLAALYTACIDEPSRPSTVVADSLDAFESGAITGRVLGPAGSICASLPAGARLVVRPINLATQAFAAPAQTIFCPADTYSFFVPDGTYLLRLDLPADETTLAGFPWRSITTPPIVVAGADVARDLPVATGTPLGGGVTIDGEPIAGLPLVLTYDEAPIFGAAIASSSADGGWTEFFGRTPTLLQAGIRLRSSLFCGALGAIVQATSPESFLFPDEASGLFCTMATSPATRFSHDFTRLVTTPLAGEIGGADPGLSGEFGQGWGVQFPVAAADGPVHLPLERSHLFRGGLVVAIQPDRMLSGVDLSGYVQCEPECRDFGRDAHMSFASSKQFGKKVMWHYSDAPSAEGVGLKVQQRSFDGRRPADYVLFRFRFTNSSAAPVTFHAGLWADWDVGDDATDNVGTTDLDGRLMYMTSEGEGTLAGSLLLSSATTYGNHFRSLRDSPPLMSTYVAALSGEAQVPTTASPGDNLYLHGVGPITLAPDGSDEIWIAIVAGEDLAQLHANAAAAAADIARHRESGEEVSAGEVIETTVTGDRLRRRQVVSGLKSKSINP